MRHIETERLILRNFVTSDWDALKEIVLQYQASEYAAYDHQWPTGDDDLQKITSWFAGGDDFLAVCLKNTGRLIGYIALNPTAQPGQYNIGYCFSFAHHGRGYATEGCQAVVDFAFAGLNAERLVTGTALANTPSCRLLDRLGLRLVSQSTGSFRHDEAGRLIKFVGGTFELTRADWQARREAQAGN